MIFRNLIFDNSNYNISAYLSRTYRLPLRLIDERVINILKDFLHLINEIFIQIYIFVVKYIWHYIYITLIPLRKINLFRFISIHTSRYIIFNAILI